MPRRRGGGGGRARGKSGGGFFGSPAPAKKSQAPPPAVPQQRQGGGFFSTMAQGFALGTGSAVAHEAIHGAVRSFSGGSEEQPHHQQQQQQVAAGGEACGAQQKAFLDCMQANSGEMTMCQYYFDAMQKCKISGDSLQY
mmetsp:Transcript_14288/g.36019  ORF Transcript_14288/g.36019 Transcript_14288/m.36019 type:complete len:139 (+) Transcript_14288:104-520(+)